MNKTEQVEAELKRLCVRVIDETPTHLLCALDLSPATLLGWASRSAIDRALHRIYGLKLTDFEESFEEFHRCVTFEL